MDALTPELVAVACAVALLAGLVKGLVGFAMPMILISGLSMMVPPDVALGWLILPTLVTNLWQALRQGAGAAWASVRRFRRFLLAGFVLMVFAAQLVTSIPSGVLFLVIGVPMTLYAGLTLAGRPLRLPSPPGARVEYGAGAVAGFFGGISGVWGPPTVALLTALDTEKSEHLRVQGVIYGAGAVVLMGAHLASGVLNAETFKVSALLVPPALLGIWAGFAINDRIDQAAFRRLTLILLLLAGLNLLRRALFAG
ncbi:sulfite exporter TauE/SafE family protein [Roseovarius sp.]|uniref:sulfite exporter TauE/SafE family protein n=1 Tax=Roseovarius sp. TaxID=1486281 RepID=UPI002615EF30|nr:sulfite exporter TauE/SafE family protein [Roseovarius sp.]MDM8166288.1 sulfite exporter TauE/SafE family protein [Roseovarius sp.]